MNDDAPEARMLDAVVEISDHVVHRSFEEETLLLNLETGQYHGLNETGGRMLELLDGTQARLRDAGEARDQGYDVGLDASAPHFVGLCPELESGGLLVVEARAE